jgi:replicative DNA helicase
MTELKNNIHYSWELESAVIGIAMLEKTAFGRTHGLIDRDVIYYNNNRVVYDAISELYHMGLPIDELTVVDRIINVKGMKDIGTYNTPYYVTRLTNIVCSGANLEYHCLILKRMWMEREVIKLTHGGLKLEGDVSGKLIQLQTAIQRIKSGDYQQEWFDMSELMIGLLKHQEEIATTGGNWIKTGIRELDERNGGFYGGQLIVIGARPSVGKSAFMGQVAMNMAMAGKKVGIVSLEMSNNEIAGRLAAIDTDIDFSTIYRNLFRDENERSKFYDRIANKTSELPIFVSDKTRVNSTDIRAKADKLKASKGLDFLFIDYLQLISADQSSNKTRENVVSEISRACKLMAKELNIPVCELCQLNRASTHRKGDDRYPNLSDLRESGSIEQDADVVMFIHRDWTAGITQDEHGETTEGKADLIVRKWRNGASNLHIPLGFDGPKMKFILNNNKSGWRQIVPESIQKPFKDSDDEAPF